MGTIWTGGKGTPLREIIAQLGNKNYEYIEFRCKWVENGEEYDEYFGECKYIDGELIPLDHDSYSLDDLYIEWEEWHDTEGKYYDKEKTLLTLWEHGEYE